jgi:hypothetical protein
MLILPEFAIEFTVHVTTAMVALLHLHPSLLPRLRSGNELVVEALGIPSREEFDQDLGARSGSRLQPTLRVA